MTMKGISNYIYLVTEVAEYFIALSVNDYIYKGHNVIMKPKPPVLHIITIEACCK
jgi:hypothetical protein